MLAFLLVLVPIINVKLIEITEKQVLIENTYFVSIM